MVLKFFILFTSILSILGIFTVYAIKIAWQYQYLRLQSKLKRSDFFDAWNFKMDNEIERRRRFKAMMTFPLLFPMEMENESNELEEIKKTIKKLHIILYLIIAYTMVIGIYTSNAYPNGLFN